MKTELEKKLNKLPEVIVVDNNKWFLSIYKSPDLWYVDYTDDAENSYLSVAHTSLEAAIDTALKEIKNL